MLGSDRFAFETPNVIDPGDLPPSRPNRKVRSASPESHTNSTHSGDDSSQESYQEARHSVARLLHDIGDLDLSPVPADEREASRDANGCGDDDEDEENRINGHSLPTVEEARLYATSLLKESDRLSPSGTPARVTPSSSTAQNGPFGRTVKLATPGERRHLVRRRLLCLVARVGLVVLAVVVLIAVAVGLVNRDKSDRGAASPPLASLYKTQRHEDVVAFLSDNGVSTLEDLTTPGMPQYMAANWVADVDPLRYDIPSSLHSGESRLVQRYVLSTFFFSLMGISWTHTYKFMSTEDECAWFVSEAIDGFLEKRYSLGVTCDPDDFQVTNIYIPDNGVAGQLPAELRHLSHLTMLALPGNQLSGKIPGALESLTGMIYFDLSRNDLSGPIPLWIGDYEQLEVLGLSSNRLSGDVPLSLGRLGRLKTLALDDNSLSGDISSFAENLSHLEFFYADRNLLTAEIDDSFLMRLARLRELDLSNNMLKGSDLPLHLIEHENLQVLDLEANGLRGSLPNLSEDNMVLEFLSLRDNELDGIVPDAFPRLLALTHLDLHGNDLIGVPSSMGSMTTLTSLYLGDNSFPRSRIPSFISQLVSLKELSLTQSQLTGYIPSWLPPDLQFLDLSYNELQGVPSDVWNLPQLEYVLLHNNMFSGSVPDSIEGIEKLKLITLHRNAFTGDADFICDRAPDLDLITVDCNTGLTCSTECCPKCCDPVDPICFQAEVSNYVLSVEGRWENNFQRASYSFDPSILAESKVVSAVSP